MNVVPYDKAPPYEAPGHTAMAMRRLQGREAGPSDTVWLGVSVVEPGGGTTMSASAVEKFYVMLEGELEMSTSMPDGSTSVATLRAKDSCRIAPHESRQITNRSAAPASVLLVMPNT